MDEFAPQPDPQWDGQIERVAVYLYRSDQGWAPDAVWSDLDDYARNYYLERARTVGFMFNFPNHSNTVFQLSALCPCDHDPENSPGPERECLLHGDLPFAVTRARRIEQAATKLAKHYPSTANPLIGAVIDAVDIPFEAEVSDVR